MISGDIIGRYRLVNRLGQGGMGEVWLATATGHGGFTKTVVLKTLLPAYAHDPLFVEMLAHEARTCAKLSHPNLIEVFDFTEHDGIYLLAMEHVDGHPLHHIMRAAKARGRSLPAWFALRVAWECCRGLQYAHEQGVIHCDLSPSNVMVTFTGITKILDFGVSHLLACGPKSDRLKGKVSYMAPERIMSLATDCRTDTYSLGVMLYLIFTGQLPFNASRENELLQMIVKTRPRPPSELAPIDARIERLILRAMNPDPDKRFQTAGEVLAELAPCLEGQLGAHGQHDVATFVAAVIDTSAPRREAQAVERVLPVVVAPPVVAVPLAGDVSDAVTRPPGGCPAPQEIELDDFDIEVASSVQFVPLEPATPPPTTKPIRIARGSSAEPPLASLSKLFAQVPEVHEARTSVQSLFGERPSLAFVGDPSKIFDGARPGGRPDPLVGEALEAPRADVATRDEPPQADAPDRARAPRRGGFGSYSRVRPQGQTEWPWSTSRTKPD